MPSLGVEFRVRLLHYHVELLFKATIVVFPVSSHVLLDPRLPGDTATSFQIVVSRAATLDPLPRRGTDVTRQIDMDSWCTCLSSRRRPTLAGLGHTQFSYPQVAVELVPRLAPINVDWHCQPELTKYPGR